MELVYWRDPKKSAVAFGMSLLVLLSLATFSVISVLSYLLLALLCVTITFRIYKSVIQAVQKSGEGHPFKYDRSAWDMLEHGETRIYIIRTESTRIELDPLESLSN